MIARYIFQTPNSFLRFFLQGERKMYAKCIILRTEYSKEVEEYQKV
jgi:hypothetical protein